MPRAPDPRISKAKEMYLKGAKLVEIASQLNLPEGTVRRWKCTHKWDNERSDGKSERSKRKRGAQPGNHNATGPPGNHNAEKHGFFSKYLPEETLSIIEEMPKNPLDILWDQIQIQYAAIIRSQSIMYVKDHKDSSPGAFGPERAWDKQANFLSAQSRAMKTLEGLIKQYDELLHKNWELATQEQKMRIEHLKADTERIQKSSIDTPEDEGVVIINDAPKEEAD